MRRIAAGLLLAVALFTLGGFAGVPILLRHIARVQLAAALNRPVGVGDIAFNPYTLRLHVDNLHIGEPASSKPFVEVGALRVKASWKSLLRLAPVIEELTIDQPAIRVVRIAQQRFNFSDLIGGPPQAAAAKSSPPSTAKPLRFAVSNIRLIDGEVRFDDQVLHKQHSVEHIQLGVPFIANLPAAVDIYVQPLLRMIVDGSPLVLTGKAKPFSAPPESVVDLKLRGLGLAAYVGYLPRTLPLKILQGTLSCALQVHFVNAEPEPLLRLNGEASLDGLDVRDGADAPLVSVKHASVRLADVEPLESIAHLEGVRIDGLTSYVVLDRDGTSNWTPFTGGNAAPGGNRTQARAAPQGSAPTDLSLESFELSDSALNFTDKSGATPAAVAVRGLHVGLKGLRTKGQAQVPFDAGASLGGGGSIAVKGALDLAGTQVTTEVSLDQVGLPSLKSFVQSVLAADIAAGKLSAHAKVQTRFASSHFNVHAGSASITLDKVEVRAPGNGERLLGWTRLSASVGQVDLAARQATLTEVRADGLHLLVRRGRDGGFNLASLLRPPSPSSPRGGNAAPGAPGQPWQYRIASVAIDNTEASFEDDTRPQPVKLAVASLNLHLKGVSNDLSKPIALDLGGTLAPTGSFKVTGTATPTPFRADLRVVTRRLDLAGLAPYVGERLNTKITSVVLTMNGALGVASAPDNFRVNYNGDAALGNVRMLDKVTNERFLRWSALSASDVDATYGDGAPRVRIGSLGLADFYARIILNRDGKLNLRDIIAIPQAPPTSLTRAEPAAGAAPPAMPPSPSVAAAGKPVGALLRLGGIALQGGHINYTDNFIKPNYSANLTDIAGRVGGFGTRSTKPAEAALRGLVNGSAPIDINGSINPLAPMAFLDLKANAEGVELTSLTPYSTKYTGYPITKGTLTVNVHYRLAERKLTADNHILLNQLTFGERVESPNATNLPVRLAVALLRDPQGRIDVDVPVSGSLSDPQFSFGNAILHAFMNVIVKAAASPFKLLASVGGGPGGGGGLAYVEFAPGLATLTPESQTKLATLATALQDRPALRLNIAGRVDPAFDREGLCEAMLATSVKKQKIRDLLDEGEKVAPDSVEVAPGEYDKYLKRAYQAANFSKPQNFLGLDKSLPPDEMKKLILAHIKVTDRDLRELADARANAVRRSLSGKVSPSRLFVIAPKLDANGITDQGKTTRADLSLD